MKYFFIFIIGFWAKAALAQQAVPVKDSAKTGFEITEGNLFIKLPNSEWKLAEKTEGPTTGYIFKRNEIKSPKGNFIIPAIMIYTENASQYDGDIINYSINKRLAFSNIGLKFDKILVQNSKDYPLTFKNAIFMKAAYNAGGEEHLLYMIHIINSKDQGIQVLMDMTKDIAGKYEDEFMSAVKSLREL